jgi:hypothetical protein
MLCLDALPDTAAALCARVCIGRGAGASPVHVPADTQAPEQRSITHSTQLTNSTAAAMGIFSKKAEAAAADNGGAAPSAPYDSAGAAADNPFLSDRKPSGSAAAGARCGGCVPLAPWAVLAAAGAPQHH